MQFRTKARAVDLLGKGQIADLPTAITELWKNGYDAYADNLTAEIYLDGYKGLQAPIFIITDDGTGMSKDDIFDKWLVLGVDSKSRSEQKDTESEQTLWKTPRVKAGEKGIGRLSVAYLGSPMLMLTKKMGHPIQAMFFDWRLLENYNMYLEDVQIPVEDISISDCKETFAKLKSDFLKNFPDEKNDFTKDVWKDQIKLKEQIIYSVHNVEIPLFFENDILNRFSAQDSHGTIFIVFEPEEQIIKLVKDNDKEDDVNDTEFVRTSLAGFTNQFKPKNDRLPFTCKFLIHKDSNELVPSDFFTSSGQFFDEEDYELADIIIDGYFDGNGTFAGTLKLYDKVINYSYTNSRRKDVRNYYGKFPIKLGYSMGKLEDSSLKEESWNRINKKVDAYGGIYLYRDGFRVLPYGRIDADFLGLEERRSKRIGSYFFSYRRMFGYIELSRTENASLKDKSSREGLINNGPYRAFKEDLIALFIDLAKEYFSDKAKQSVFLDEKKRLNEQDEVIKKDKKREQQEKKAFTQSLKEYPRKFDDYRSEYEATLNELESKITQSSVLFSEIERLLSKIRDLDIRYNSLLPVIPKRYKLTELQEDRLFEFEKKLNSFRTEIADRSEVIIKRAKDKLAIQDLRKEFTNTCNAYQAELESIANKNIRAFDERFDELSKDIKNKFDEVIAEFKEGKESGTNAIVTKEDVEAQSKLIKSLYEKLSVQLTDSIVPLVEHVNRINFDIDEEMLQGAYKAQYDEIKHQWELTKETSQLGIAVEIIDHEFNALYSQINASLDTMEKEGPYTSSPSFQYLKKSFKTLEDKYALLSPLYRINGSIAKDVNCSDFEKFICSFFENKIESNDVNVQFTSTFRSHSIFIKEPVIYTVLINVMNNALYWIKNAAIRTIIFDYKADTDEILIKNSGEPIPDNRLEKIFELFYSKRPNGRGIGLYLSKQSLNDNNFDLYATNDPIYNTLQGACFVITKQLKKE
ncbi:MAG: ATP-binding protein [Bacteroidales bacterium]|nr:ATP-binding protein [Bacteroidales bacterium]